MADLLTYRGTVYPWQCDHIGHMNVMSYVGKFDEATWHLFAQIGLTPSYLRESGRGMAARCGCYVLGRDLKETARLMAVQLRSCEPRATNLWVSPASQ